MTDRGYGREVLEVRVREDRAVPPQPVESARVLAAEPGQVIVAELVDDENDHQLRRPPHGFQRGGGPGAREGAAEQGHSQNT